MTTPPTMEEQKTMALCRELLMAARTHEVLRDMDGCEIDELWTENLSDGDLAPMANLLSARLAEIVAEQTKELAEELELWRRLFDANCPDDAIRQDARGNEARLLDDRLSQIRSILKVSDEWKAMWAAALAERDQARRAIEQFGNGTEFDWNVLGRIDELERDLAATREREEGLAKAMETLLKFVTPTEYDFGAAKACDIARAALAAGTDAGEGD